jgi:hypothetical protein
MTHLTNGRPCFAILALAVAALSAPACGPDPSCGGPTNSLVALPPFGGEDSIASVSAQTCSAQRLDASRFEVTSSTGARCAVHVRMTSGALFVVLVQFEYPDPFSGCDGFYPVAGDPVWHNTDPDGPR